MELSTEREAFLLKKYEPFLIKMVSSYLPKRQWGNCFADRLQDARLAFLLHLRKVPDEAHIFPCRRTIFHALYLDRLKDEHVRKSGKVTFMPLTQVAEMLGDDGTCQAQMEALAEVDSFCNALAPDEKRIAALLARGYSRADISKITGRTWRQVDYRVDKIRCKATM